MMMLSRHNSSSREASAVTSFNKASLLMNKNHAITNDVGYSGFYSMFAQAYFIQNFMDLFQNLILNETESCNDVDCNGVRFIKKFCKSSLRSFIKQKRRLTITYVENSTNSCSILEIYRNVCQYLEYPIRYICPRLSLHRNFHFFIISKFAVKG